MSHNDLPRNTAAPFLEESDISALLESLCAPAPISPRERQLCAMLLRAGLAALQKNESSAGGVSFRDAATARLNAAAHRRPSTLSDLRSYTQRFLRHADFAEKPLHCITTEECRVLLKLHFSGSAPVYRKAQSTLHSIFAYGCRQGWSLRNPTEGIDLPPVREHTLTPLSLSQIHALMCASRCADLRIMSPALRLMLWCGVRPTEVRRLRWRDIDREEKCVYIESHASKTGGARAVPLRGAALALLRERRPADDFIAPRDWQRLWKRLRARARLLPWRQDTLRHTFASMHLKRFHDILRLQEEMGHYDTRLLRTRYLNLRSVKSKEAVVFFSMRE